MSESDLMDAVQLPIFPKIKIWTVLVAITLILGSSFLYIQSVFALGNPVKISTSSFDTVYPQIVTDGSGYLHLLWMEVTSDWGGYANPGILYSRWNGDTWS